MVLTIKIDGDDHYRAQHKWGRWWRAQSQWLTSRSGHGHELRALHQIAHLSPYTMPCLGSLSMDNSLSIMMPYLSCSLARILNDRVLPLHERQAAAIGFMLLSGVSAIHAEGLLHRDIKPANLLLNQAGVLMIADFGQAPLLLKDSIDLKTFFGRVWKTMICFTSDFF